jgi:hypothetical protein
MVCSPLHQEADAEVFVPTAMCCSVCHFAVAAALASIGFQ